MSWPERRYADGKARKHVLTNRISDMNGGSDQVGETTESRRVFGDPPTEHSFLERRHRLVPSQLIPPRPQDVIEQKTATQEIESLPERLQAENAYLRGEVSDRLGGGVIVGQSEQIKRVL